MDFPDPANQQLRAVLRTTGIALQSEAVGVWEVEESGTLRPIATSLESDQARDASRELEATLSNLKIPRSPGRRWVASRLRRRWLVAPVRTDPPPPSPIGVERRGPERVALELTGAWIGLLGGPATYREPTADSHDRIDQLIGQVPAIFWTTDHELRTTSVAGAGIRALGIDSVQVIGASLVDPAPWRAAGLEVTDHVIEAHRRALKGDEALYTGTVGDLAYDAHVRPLRNRNGDIIGVVGIAMDVSDRERLLLELRRSSRELESFFDDASLGLHWAGKDGTILRATQAELDMFGYRDDEYVGRNLAEFHVDRMRLARAFERLKRGETLRNYRAQVRHRDGSVRDVLMDCSVLFDRGRFVHTRCLTRDVTEQLRFERMLAQYKAIVDSADDSIVGLTLDGVISSWNPGAQRLYGYTPVEMVGQHWGALISSDRADEVTAVFERVRRGETVERYETTRTRKDGSRVDVSVTISPIRGSHGQLIGASAIARDITARKRAEEQLLHGALHDPLTDLPNRAFFVERVAQSLERARRELGYRFAVMFLDFDGFKVVNDSLGHVVGDELLKLVAHRLQEYVRPGDLVARLGGDEFTLLLEDVGSPDDVEHAARRLQVQLATPYQIEGRDLVVSASIGVVLSDPSYEKPEDLLRDADIAMYRAKGSGRARYQMFDIRMRERVRARFWMEAELRGAVERGEFGLMFQPIVDMKTGRLHAFEALVRWYHPDRGMILPMQFIPVAEETGLIVPLGAWALHQACREAQRWRRWLPGNVTVPVSVNLSARQLGDPHIVDDVRSALVDTGLDPACLQLEITESGLVENVERSAELLRNLRSLRVDLLMDDFGTGYSSLGYLRRFPLQMLKIDRSFVRRMGQRRTDLEILRSIVDLARNLGMGVVAEGVETEAQRRRLLAFGCRLGQGFHFARPLRAAELDPFLRTVGGGGAPR